MIERNNLFWDIFTAKMGPSVAFAAWMSTILGLMMIESVTVKEVIFLRKEDLEIWKCFCEKIWLGSMYYVPSLPVWVYHNFQTTRTS